MDYLVKQIPKYLCMLRPNCWADGAICKLLQALLIK